MVELMTASIPDPLLIIPQRKERKKERNEAWNEGRKDVRNEGRGDAERGHRTDDLRSDWIVR